MSALEAQLCYAGIPQRDRVYLASSERLMGDCLRRVFDAMPPIAHDQLSVRIRYPDGRLVVVRPRRAH